MKFRDGMWLVAEGKRVEYAEEVYTTTVAEDGTSMRLLCPTKKIMNRGDTLNLSTLTIDIESAFDGVISVETTHWHGAQQPRPNFDLYPGPEGKPSVSATVSQTSNGTTLRSGSLSTTVSSTSHDFDIKFHSTATGKEVTSLLNRSVGLAYSPAPSTPMQTADMRDISHYIFTQSSLGVGENVYGLGERFGPFNKLGQSISIWNSDGGTSSDQAYKNVPFWLSSKGYGVFIDTPDRVDLEIGSERSCRVQTSVQGQKLKWYIIYGPSPKEVLAKYSVLTGKANRVPSWSFGLWLSTSFTTDYDEKTVTSFLTQMKERDIPVEVFHYDCFWLRAFHWCDFVFSSSHFPDPQSQISRLKSSNLISKVCVWINPYLGQASPVFAEAASKGYLLKRKNGDVFQWDLWQAGMGIVDFTNPAAVKWYIHCLERLFDAGVDAIKTDFGERIPSNDVAWFDDKMDPKRMHNFYGFIYNKIVYEALQKRYGKDQAVLFARTATAGTQRFPLQWGGDCESTLPAMAESIRGGLSLGLSAYSFWSVDIGGFEGSPSPGIYKRWVAWGLLCSHSRLHGSGSYRVPWAIDGGKEDDESATAVLRKFVHLKCSLMPYLYAQAESSRSAGLPLSLRAMFLEFPEDPTCWYLDRQFMIGNSLLCAPVFSEDAEGEVEFYLPAGKWTDWWTDETVQGPGWRKEKHGFGSLPLYAREGSILVLGKEGEKRTVYSYSEDVRVKMFFPSKESKTELVDSDGKSQGELKAVNDEKSWKLAGTGMKALKGNWKVEVVA